MKETLKFFGLMVVASSLLIAVVYGVFLTVGLSSEEALLICAAYGTGLLILSIGYTVYFYFRLGGRHKH